MKNLLIVSALFVFLGLFCVSCEKKGPGERAGESIDKALEEVSDAISPEGPLEKVGEKLDKALNNRAAEK